MPSEDKGKKVTVEDETPATSVPSSSQPASGRQRSSSQPSSSRPSSSGDAGGVAGGNGTRTTRVRVETPSYASAGTASDPARWFLPALPGSRDRLQVQHTSSRNAQPAVNGPNPAVGPQPQYQHRAGRYQPQAQQGPGAWNTPLFFQRGPSLQRGAYHNQFIHSSPHYGHSYVHHNHPGVFPYLSGNLIPSGANHNHFHHHNDLVSSPSAQDPDTTALSALTAAIGRLLRTLSNLTMADYGNGTMPNTGQHFQPPVPDTTYGPMHHVYRPRYDNGVPFAAPAAYPAGQVYPSYHSGPCECQFPNAPAPVYATQAGYPQQGVPMNVHPGAATIPVQMPMMAYQPQPHAAMYNGAAMMPGMPAAMPTPGVAYAMQTPGAAQPAVQVGTMAAGQPQFITGTCAPSSLPHGMLPPDIMGVGKTQGENTLDLLESMHRDNLLEPQDFKPDDDDPARMYLLRELDGNWTKRNRFTIDRLPTRWYITPWGGFYAVRLED
ncbi:hypothetical protein JX266_008969 [Neoarthrinium moseri]|nr:hypothetical protein JX266_008969 [Neoarthrinium moseri]